VTGLAAGAFAAALAVVCGAFGAHALAGIGEHRLGFWTTAAHYHFIAAFGMMAEGLRARSRWSLKSPVTAFASGIALFSGSLYAMALGAPSLFGVFTPVGGLSLIVGFLWLGLRAVRSTD
jgi:uncharacterized membrane protein YgdD (TMEM256/DUF423 family)